MNTNKPIIGIASKHYSTYKTNKIDTYIRDVSNEKIEDLISYARLAPSAKNRQR